MIKQMWSKENVVTEIFEETKMRLPYRGSTDALGMPIISRTKEPRDSNLLSKDSHSAFLALKRFSAKIIHKRVNYHEETVAISLIHFFSL